MESLPHEFQREPRYCEHCKKPLPPNVAKNRKYCDECRIIVSRQKAREKDREYREKARKKKVYADPTKWKPKLEDIEYCRICIYHETSYWNHLCNFYTRTGQRRGCKAGVGCERREIYNSLNEKSI